MCGILCCYGNLESLSKEQFQKGLSITRHRGPDNSGVFFSEGIYLGSNRLSIVDHSNVGNQPIISEYDKSVIVYNGMIYNYEEIKEKLLRKGINSNPILTQKLYCTQ